MVHFYLPSHKKPIPIFHGDELSKLAKGSNRNIKKIMFFLLKSRRLKVNEMDNDQLCSDIAIRNCKVESVPFISSKILYLGDICEMLIFRKLEKIIILFCFFRPTVKS